MQQSFAETLSLLIRPHRNILDQQVAGRRDHFDQGQ
jgi:hypothetical protein